MNTDKDNKREGTGEERERERGKAGKITAK